MLVDIDKIKIPERARKAFPNIDKLAMSIKDNGLIHPPTVTHDLTLIAGERRLRACKHLGYKQIEVRVMAIDDEVHLLKMERDENDNRENFTFSEAVSLGLKIEEEEKKKARGRMEDPMQNFAEGTTGITRDSVAEAVGLGSGEQYRKAKYIYKNANPELLEQLDADEISIHAAYKKLKNEKEELQRTVDELKSTPPKTVTVEKEIIATPKHVLDQIERLQSEVKSNQSAYQQKLEQLSRSKQESDNKLKELQEYLDSEKREIEKARLEKEKLELQAHISIFELQTGIHTFINNYAPSVFLQGAVASSTFTLKDDLLDSIIALEGFTKQLREMTGSKIVGQNQDYIEVTPYY